MSIEAMREAWKTLQDLIGESASRVGRTAEKVKVVAVSKMVLWERIQEARDGLNLRIFGENRVQEALEKFSGVSSNPALELHLIGHLQRNKVSKAVGFFQLIQSVDSLSLGEEIGRRAEKLKTVQEILLQANCSTEETKNGFTRWEDLKEAALRLSEIPSLRIRGLMTIAPFTTEESPVRRSFALLREWKERLTALSPLVSCNELSMGMSNDFQLAIEEGATMIRIGTALFGSLSAGD